MDPPLGSGGRAGAAARRLALPQRGGQTDRSVDGARRGASRPVAPADAEHHSLDQVDHHRSRIGRRRRRPDARPGGRPLQADQQRPLRERLPRIHVSLHARRDRPASIVLRSACRIRISRTSAGGGARRRGYAAAAIPGSFRTRPSSARSRSAAPGDLSVHACPSSACGFTGCHVSKWSWIRSRASAARPLRARGSVSVLSEPIWTNRI